MNAIVGLCHFCEAHGPRPLFCTFTTDNEKITTESSKVGVQCSGCTSLGPETVFVSRDDDGTIFCSRESVPNADVTSFLSSKGMHGEQAPKTYCFFLVRDHRAHHLYYIKPSIIYYNPKATLSPHTGNIEVIHCFSHHSVNWSKEGGVVYFNDTHGHVLSLTFQVKDTWARGLKRWFSLVILMKDKMLLLNITPVLSEHMQKISKELQELAEVVFDAEQKVCSQRALRLKTGRNDFVQSRSLMHLTGDDNVFKRLHSHFTWMLKAGAHTYSETLYTSQDLLMKLQPHAVNNTMFEPGGSTAGDKECIPLRQLEKLLSKAVFRILMYCTLTGVYIVIKTSNIEASTIINGLSRLLPVNITNNPRLRQGTSEEQLPPSVCFLEENENSNFCIKWGGTMPAKCPLLMNRIENSMNNDKFNDDVLHQHVKSLQLEWIGIAKAMKAAIDSSGAKSDAVAKLKQVFGLAQHDEPLLNYWKSTFCS